MAERIILGQVSLPAASTGLFLRDDGVFAAVNGLTIGNAVTGGGADRVLYENAAQQLATSARFKFDGTNLSLVNPTAASSGVLDQPSPYLIFGGREWASGADTPYNWKLRGTRVGIEFMMTDTGGSPPAFSLLAEDRDYPGHLTHRMRIRNPIQPGWGGDLKVTYDGSFMFVDGAGVAAGLTPGCITWTGSPVSGYRSIAKLGTYGTLIQSSFGDPIRVGIPPGGFGSTYFHSEAQCNIGPVLPTDLYTGAACNIFSTTEQLRIGYDNSNFYQTTVNSAGTVDFNAWGGVAMFRFNDVVRIQSTLGTQLATAYDASTHMTIETSSSGITTFSAAGGAAVLRSAVAFQFNPVGFGSSWLPFTDGNNYLSASNTIFRSAGDAEYMRFAPTLLTLQNAVNFEFGTTTGTKFGTSTGQKLSFWNKTPVAQPTTAILPITHTVGDGTDINDTSTFDGYSVGQVVAALRAIGILA